MRAFSLASQMLLPVRENSDASFDTYYCERNARAKFVLARCIDDQEETSVLLVGPLGVGKSHLLNAAITYAEPKVNGQVNYFSLSELADYDLSEEEFVELFSSFEGYSVMALDHLDSWLNSKRFSREFVERCLFNLFNHYRMSGNMLLMASGTSVDSLNIALPDLLSRMKSSLLISLNAYSDSEKEMIIQHVAIRKGFSLEDDVSSYIMKRSGRGLAELIDAIDQLDRASLTEQRKLTIPFVKKVLNW